MGSTGRSSWLSALIATGIGCAGGLIISLGLIGSGFDGPLVTILAPGIVGLVTALVLRDGWGSAGLAVGLLVGMTVASLVDPRVTLPDSVTAIIGVAAALGGYATGFGVSQQGIAADLMPRPLGLADVARLEADVRGELRSIDPNAPGAFEHATVLLRTVTEQVSALGPWSGPRATNEPPKAPRELLQLQAELLETARVAALAAGARRVVITSGGIGSGIDVQAVFGDPIESDEPLLRRPTSDVD